MLALVLPPFDNRLILQFDLEEGRNANAVTAAEALIAWVEAAREANAVMDPTSDIAVELVSADAACLRLWTAIKFIDQKAKEASDKLNEIPQIKKLVVATVLTTPPAVLAAAIVLTFQPEPTAKLSPAAEARYREEKAKVNDSPAVQSKVQNFYKKTAKDRAITGVKVSDRLDGPPIVSIPRSEFHDRSGLWLPQELDPPTRPGGGIWNVVVTHPVAIGEPRVWGFMRDGLPFKAKVTDRRFLAAIRDRTLGLVVQEGVMMQIEVKFQERLIGQTWEPVAGSWEVPRVIEPRPGRPLAPSLPFFGVP